MDFDFVSDRYWSVRRLSVPQAFTVSSSANGWIDTVAGIWSQVAANTLRRSGKGALIETSQVNIVKHNRDLTNAAWTKSNTTAAKDQTGIDGVANSASSLTATDANGTCLQAITQASTSRFQSAWVKRITGSGTVEMTQDNGSTWTGVTVTAGWTKVEIAAQTLANPTVGFRIVTSGDAIAVDFVQNVTGTLSTSPILTGAASVTRNVDLVDMLWTNFPVLAALRQFTADVTFTPNQVTSAGTMFDMTDGSDDNTLRNNFRVSDFQAGFTVRVANNVILALDPLDTEGFFVEIGKTSRFVTSVDMVGLTLSVSLDGSGEGDASVALPASVSEYPAAGVINQLRLGAAMQDGGTAGAVLNGYLKRLTVYETVYTPAEAALLSAAA